MVFHATLSSEDVVAVAAYTDVLILMIYGYSKYMVKRTLVFRYENDKCADIETVSLYLGKYVLASLIYSFITTTAEIYI